MVSEVVLLVLRDDRVHPNRRAVRRARHVESELVPNDGSHSCTSEEERESERVLVHKK